MELIKTIFIIFFLFTLLIFTLFSIVYFYHFKHFGLPSDPNVKKLLNIFLIGGAVLIATSLAALILNLIS